ncbi:MAG: V-type ATPase subunit [Clostridium sp.]|nr:V-type ATPase subunit [Clostridium sp.]
MGNSLTYGGIITKVKAMSSHLITKEEYQQIAHLESIADYINFLRKKPSYALIFKNINEMTIHRGQIEELMKISLLMDYSKIYTFCKREHRAYLEIFFLRYEVNVIKECLELIYNQKNALQLADFKPFFEQHSELDIVALADCHSLDDFINTLAHTRYHSILSNLYNSGDNVSLSEYEAQLDVFYYQTTWKMINKNFKGKEQKSLLTLFGTQIDMLNIMWIYRSKKFYSLDSKEIYLTIIPIHYHLKKPQLTKLLEAPGIPEFQQLLSTTKYSMFNNVSEDKPLETIYSQVMNRTYKQLNSKESHSMLHILYYLFRKEEELDHITTALECIRYKLVPLDTLKYLYIT